jgi:hypothetical protein
MAILLNSIRLRSIVLKQSDALSLAEYRIGAIHMRKRVIIIGLVALVIAGAGVYFFRDRLFPELAGNPYVRDALPEGYKPKVRIEVPQGPPGDFRGIVFPASPSPFVLMKTELWNSSTQTKAATIHYDVGPSSLQALSSDGKHFALDKDGAIEVLDLSSGQSVLRIAYDERQGNLYFLEFSAPGRVVVAARAFSAPDPKKPYPSGTVAVEVWDIAEQRRTHSYRISDFDPKGGVISPDGKKLVVMTANHLWIYDLETGNTIAQWQPLMGKYKSLITPTGIRFSPDGREVAALINMNTQQMVMCWDASNGQLNSETMFPALTTVGPTGMPLQWLPSGAGWLVNGHALVSRAAGRIVWLLHTKAPFVHAVAILDQDHLLAPLYENEKHAMVSVPIPWKDIDAALKAEASGDAAPLKPYQPVSLQIDIGDLHLGNEQQTRDELTKALAERLAGDGIPVADGQSTLIYARFKEVAGRTLKVHQMGGMFNPNAGAPPREAKETQMALEIGIQLRDTSETLWRTYLTRGAGLIVSGQGTTRDLHQDTFGALLGDIRKLPWPYFIPASKDLSQLPIVSQL